MQREVTIALGVPHTPWVPSRVESLSRLLDALGLNAHGAPVRRDAERVIESRIFGERAANHEWSEAMWTWLASTDATHCLSLQDDVVPMPGFWAALHAMLEAVPDQVIGLQVPHPAAPALAEEGHRWLTTSDMLIGCAYVMPRALLAEFLEWRSAMLKPGALEAITEDTMIGVWCLVTGRRVYHPLPTVVDHDTALASTYGNDGHQGRRSPVRWDTGPHDDLTVATTWQAPPPGCALCGAARMSTHQLCENHWLERMGEASGARIMGSGRLSYSNVQEFAEEKWIAERGGPRPAHLGRFYEATPTIAYEWVKGFDAAAFTRARQDDGARVKRGIGLRLRARNIDRPRPSVLIATPTQGAPAPQSGSMLSRLAVASEFDVVDAYELVGAHLWSEDIVRVRSRYVRMFLETDCTHLLFLDDDVSSDVPARLLGGMLAAKRDVLLAPYPRRDGVDFARARRVEGVPAEAAAYRYALKLLNDEAKLEVGADGCAEVEGLGLGCALITRAALERMVAHYRDELGFDDGLHGPTVALFQLILRERALLSEDYSFCARWRAMGGKVHMYLGAGAPLNHHGQHIYRGAIEAFGLRRDER